MFKCIYPLNMCNINNLTKGFVYNNLTKDFVFKKQRMWVSSF